MKKGWKILVFTVVFLFSSVTMAIGAKPGTATNLRVTSQSNYKSILFEYDVENSKQNPDQYIVKRDSRIVYEGPNKSFEDTGLTTGIEYTYTIEAWFRGKLLATSIYTTTTKMITISEMNVGANVQEQSAVISWVNERKELVPEQYKIYLNGTLLSTQAASTSSEQTLHLPDLTPGTYTIKVEGWYEGELVSEGNSTFAIAEPIVFSPITVNVATSEQSAVIAWTNNRTSYLPDQYNVYVNGDLASTQPATSSLEQTYDLINLQPGPYTVRVEGLHKGELVSEGSTSFTIQESLPVANMDVTYSLNPDFSVDLSFAIVDPVLTPDRYAVFINSSTEPVFELSPEETTLHVADLTPGEYYAVRVEAYQEGIKVGEGSTKFIAPHLVEGYLYDQDFDSRIAVTQLEYDESLQDAERMVINRKRVVVVDRQLVETGEPEVIYDGQPIDKVYEDSFTLDFAGNYYYVSVFNGGELVGAGKVWAPNALDY